MERTLLAPLPPPGTRTVKAAVPEMLPDVARIVVMPEAKEVARPVVAMIVATPVFDEVQVTAVVRSCVELSEYLPLAQNCWVVAIAMEGAAGVTVMETSDLLPPPPPPPLQANIKKITGKRKNSLFDFINAYSGRD